MLREDWQHLKRKWYGVDPQAVDQTDIIQMKQNKKCFEDVSLINISIIYLKISACKKQKWHVE